MAFAGLILLLLVLLGIKTIEFAGPATTRTRIGWPRMTRLADRLRARTLQDAASVAVVVTWIAVCLHGGEVTRMRVLALVAGWIAYGALDPGTRPPPARERPAAGPAVRPADRQRVP